MKAIERLGFMVLGGALVLVGMCFSPFLPLSAQNDRFGYITCTGLRVVDQEDNELIHLSTDENGGNLVVRSIDDTGRINAKGVALGTGEYGGSVYVWGNYGSSVNLNVSEHGGLDFSP